MDWFEKIKSMNRKELAEFLVNFDEMDIASDYCKYGCPEREENRKCNHDDCIVSDAEIIEKWLQTKAIKN